MPKQKSCPKCGSINSIIKYGKNSKGVQRYQCKSCIKSFILDETPLSHLHISDYRFRIFLGFMIDDVTLDVIARNLKINIKTVLYYRYLVFKALEQYQDEVRLNGTVLIDETFIRISERQYKLVRADGKGIRGLSFNQLCIITMINLAGICVARVSSRAMALPIHYKEDFTINMGRIKRFIHDGNTKQYQFMNQFECEKINARKDNSDLYSTKMVDSLHSNLKRHFFKHAGFRLKNIQHYLNFFTYRYNHLPRSKNTNMTKTIAIKNQMILDLFNRINLVKKSITYNDFLNDKGITDILESR